MGIVVCTLNTEQDEVLCCPLCCRCLCCSRCRNCCSCRPCCCHLCSCCSCCYHHCSCRSSCCCHRPCCSACWLQCPPPGPPCSPGLRPEACFHPHHQPCDQPRPSCWSCPCPSQCCCRPRCCRSRRCCCCLNICRRAGLKQDNKTFILNLFYQT